MSLSPENLVEKMATNMPNTIPFGRCKAISDELLRIVLQAIKDGEVVEYSHKYDDGVIGDIVLKPDFQKWMEK